MPADVTTVVDRVTDEYAGRPFELNWTTPFQLLVASILSARTLNTVVNKFTPALFEKYPDARAFAEAEFDAILEDIRKVFSPGRKAETIQAVCKLLIERHGGQVPKTIDELVALPGIGRKTANVILSVAYKVPAGLLIDTHGHRVITRLGLTKGNTPEKIELELMEGIPRERWIDFGPALVLHGRYTCTAAAPKCPECILEDLCPKIGTSFEIAEAKPKKAASEPTAKKPATKRSGSDGKGKNARSA
jgi:endonuclease III